MLRFQNIFYVSRGGGGGARGAVLRQCPFSNMTRILGPKLFRRLFDTSPPSYARVGRLSVFAPKFYRKLTSDRTNMDLSDMRTKYKGDEEVSCAFCHAMSCLFHCMVIQTVQCDLYWVQLVLLSRCLRLCICRPDHNQFRSNKTLDGIWMSVLF